MQERQAGLRPRRVARRTETFRRCMSFACRNTETRTSMFLSVDDPQASKSRGRRLMPAISITPGREYKIGSVRRAPFGVLPLEFLLQPRRRLFVWSRPAFTQRPSISVSSMRFLCFFSSRAIEWRVAIRAWIERFGERVLASNNSSTCCPG
jgi:hypothetical protein